MKRYYIISGLIVFILLLGVIFQLYPSDLEFSASPCNEVLTNAAIIGTYTPEVQIKEIEKIKNLSGVDIEPIILGVQEYEWLDDNTLYARAVILINCAYEIRGGDYIISENNLMLKYEIKKPKIVADCRCAHELVYKIKNIEKKNYQIEIEEIFR